MIPALEFSNRQRKISIDLAEFRVFAAAAAARVAELIKPSILPGTVGVAFVTNGRIAEIHRKFMSINEPTDVITFQHGEIVISVEMACSQAARFSTSFTHELHLYFVHGLLHLAGWDDLTSEDSKRMASVQEEIVREIESRSFSRSL